MNARQSLFTSVIKSDLLSKGFFSSEGKMVRRIEKYFTKFDHFEGLLKDLLKKTIISGPIVWDKLVSKC